MTTSTLKDRKGLPVAKEAIDSFASALAGKAIRSGDADYEQARRIWNAHVHKHPGLIVRCAGTADVVQAVKFARAHNVLVAIRGGGHNVAGRALCDDGIVIDLSGMKAVFVDPAKATARVQGGATLGDVDRETHAFGRAVPVGVVSRTGIAGLTLGGGVGWLVRKYGLTCDNLLSCEVVTAEGEIVTASADENADLFWALRGGGGNFGIVTSFLYKTHPVSTVLGGLIVYPRDRAGDVIRHYRDFMASAPEELTAYVGLITGPDGSPVVGVIVCWCGDLAEGERVLKPLRQFGAPVMDAVQPMPFPAMQKILDDAFPDGTQNYWKSTFLKALSNDAIDVIVDHANKMQSPLSAVVIEYYAGAAGRTGAGESAFAARKAEYDVGFMAQWTDPAENEKHMAWARTMAEAMKPHSSGAYLLNFLSEEDADTIKAAFGANYPRLAQVKKKYDPTNFFSINQNIQPAA
ncbi:FAD-binding oxidoreductase [Reyranella soli]|jgi:FAD/FMN-containing dehydrogenase|uniref:FAD-linked oxidase n=1 Tax=Reyranella soli TaxID=1230389 RepID=A0A512N6L3_9HYPH|nr:FAD-binding oxidoreductase [Reyranella soli]GEP54620.1 FAD-linked oxidase [Reyranella soli]